MRLLGAAHCQSYCAVPPALACRPGMLLRVDVAINCELHIGASKRDVRGPLIIILKFLFVNPARPVDIYQ